MCCVICLLSCGSSSHIRSRLISETILACQQALHAATAKLEQLLEAADIESLEDIPIATDGVDGKLMIV